MLNNNVINALFSLLRSAIWERPIENLNHFPLKETEWKTLFDISIEQTIDGIIYDGVQNLPPELFPPREIMLTWVVRINKIEESNKQMNFCIQEQVSFFKNLRVEAILLKGQAIASYYPNPLHRLCGDIDWYFPRSKHSKQVANQLRSKGIKVKNQTSNCISYHWRNCPVEQHSNLFDIHYPFARRTLNKKVNQQLLTEKFPLAENGTYTLLPPNLNILHVNIHILKHLLAFGIGLRQICDLAILYHRLHLQYDKEDLYNTYKKVDILAWTQVLHDLLVRYIDLPTEVLPFPLERNTNSDWLMEEILIMGNFGNYDNRHSTIKANQTVKRKNYIKRYKYNLKKYFPLAPKEVISYPIMYYLERFKLFRIG